MVEKNLNVKSVKQVQIDFKSIVTNGHHEISICVKGIDFSIKRIIIEFVPRDHELNIKKK